LPVYYVIALFNRLRGIVVVTTVHNVVFHEHEILGHLANSLLFSQTDHFIVHSDRNRRLLCHIYGISRSRVSVIPHGILAPGLNARLASDRLQLRRELGLRPDSFVVLFAGLIRPYKGLEDLLRAFSVVHSRHHGTCLVVAGEPWDSWDHYQAVIDELRLNEAVALVLEHIPETRFFDIFRAADLVVLPYRKFESQSGIGLLAIGLGKPLIVTRVGGLPDLVSDRRAIVEPNDPESLANAILHVIENPRFFRKLVVDSKGSRRQYSWSDIAQRTIALYESLAFRSPRHGV